MKTVNIAPPSVLSGHARLIKFYYKGSALPFIQICLRSDSLALTYSDKLLHDRNICFETRSVPLLEVDLFHLLEE